MTWCYLKLLLVQVSCSSSSVYSNFWSPLFLLWDINENVLKRSNFHHININALYFIFKFGEKLIGNRSLKFEKGPWNNTKVFFLSYRLLILTEMGLGQIDSTSYISTFFSYDHVKFNVNLSTLAEKVSEESGKVPWKADFVVKIVDF